jgi:dTDP-4-dehydrorhamnose reductase
VAARVLLIGADGQLGTDIAAVLSSDPRYAVTALAHEQVEVCRKDSVAEAVRMFRPDVVVNTAAFHQLDRCEEDPERAFAVNAAALKGVCDVCAGAGAALVHFSTDYVFGGEKRSPYRESDPAWPVNVYGASKLAGETVIRAGTERYYILRVSGLYGKAGPRGKGLNFPDLMVKLAREKGELKVVDDQVLTPTSTLSIASRLADLLERVPFGLYHFSDEGECSWFEFAREILAVTGIPARLTPVKTGFFEEKTRRPPYTVLYKGEIRRHLPRFLSWEESLREYLLGDRTRR